MSPRKKAPKKLPPPKPDNVEQERELILTFTIPYYGKVSHGDELEESVRREMALQFGEKVKVERVKVVAVAKKKAPVAKAPAKKKASPKKAAAVKKAAPKKRR